MNIYYFYMILLWHTFLTWITRNKLLALLWGIIYATALFSWKCGQEKGWEVQTKEWVAQKSRSFPLFTNCIIMGGRIKKSICKSNFFVIFSFAWNWMNFPSSSNLAAVSDLTAISCLACGHEVQQCGCEPLRTCQTRDTSQIVFKF